MDASVERGWLEKVEEGGYKLSEKGKRTAKGFISSGSDLFGNLPGLGEKKDRRISDLLEGIVKQAEKLSDFSRRPALEIGRRLEPPSDASPMLRIRRFLTDIAYFREDVHTASWKPYEVSGLLWETLTYLWREGPQTAAELTEQLSQYRNYGEEDYASALDELEGRGWASGEEGKFTITEKGKKIRQESEDKTDQLYAAAFESLSESDEKELKGLLAELVEVIRVPDEESESEA
jgi:DNA-binding MarR family transcriptional regulator